jgi:magnesium-transporting ATPase (P-type)
LAIGVIPESLIAVLTITMATGTSRMAKSHVVVRQLNALEGSITPFLIFYSSNLLIDL